MNPPFTAALQAIFKRRRYTDPNDEGCQTPYLPKSHTQEPTE